MRFVKMLPAILLAALLCAGCGPKKPADIPNLSPATVTVVKSGAPVANANVFLVADSTTPSGSWSVSGKTDATGVAKIKTSQGDWVGEGAPEGSYKIYLTKFVEIEEPEQPANMDEDEEAKEAYYAERQRRLDEAGREIPAKMNQAETSGLTITVGSGAGELTIDVDAD